MDFVVSSLYKVSADMNSIHRAFVGELFAFRADSISTERPRIICDDRAKKLAADLKRCVYYETCSTYGFNVDRIFQDRK